jgi:hypothetical protein
MSPPPKAAGQIAEILLNIEIFKELYIALNLYYCVQAKE